MAINGHYHLAMATDEQAIVCHYTTGLDLARS